MYKFMSMPIKLGIHTYGAYTHQLSNPAFTPGNSAELMSDTPWKFWGQKPRPMEIPQVLFEHPHGNSTSFFREHQQKTFATLSGFWSLRGWGASANLLKRKICVENIFSDIFDWSSKNFWKMITADVKANKIC